MSKKEEKVITYKFPAKPADCLKLLAKIEDEGDLIALKLAPIKKKEAALREHILNTFKKDEINGLRAHQRSLSVTNTPVPVLKDWNKFFKFASKKGNDDLLSHSVNSEAWRERMEAKKTVPGVEQFNRIGLRVTRIKGESK